jgi:REP element-mobilizing transposase RayT
MGRALKRQVQQEIRWPNMAGDLRGRKREAKPRGKARVGRPRKANAGMPHAKRPALKAREPIHITIRVDDVIGRLRTRDAYMAIREAAIAVFRREDFRIVHLSIEGTHVHLLVEVDDREALSNGMRAFQGSAAKHLNAAFSKAGSWWERKRAARLGQALPKRRKGRVFSDRYHETVITNPRQARHALAYVLPRKPWAYLRRFERDFIAERLQFLEQLLRVGRCSSLQKVLRSEVYKGLVAREHVIRGDQELVCDGHERPQRAAACA